MESTFKAVQTRKCNTICITSPSVCAYYSGIFSLFSTFHMAEERLKHSNYVLIRTDKQRTSVWDVLFMMGIIDLGRGAGELKVFFFFFTLFLTLLRV